MITRFEVWYKRQIQVSHTLIYDDYDVQPVKYTEEGGNSL